MNKKIYELIVSKNNCWYTFLVLIVKTILQALNTLSDITFQTPTVIMATRVWNLKSIEENEINKEYLVEQKK